MARSTTTESAPETAPEESTEKVDQTTESDASPEPKRFVRYVGNAHERTLSGEDFKTLDPESEERPGKTSWTYKNGFSVPADKFSDNLLEVLTADGNFVVEEEGVTNPYVDDKITIVGPVPVARPTVN